MSRYKVDQTTGDLISLEDPVALPINPSASDIDNYIDGIEWIEDDNKGHYNYYIKLDGKNYLTNSVDKVQNALKFSSDGEFILGLSGSKGWNGTIEYSIDGTNWIIWDGHQLIGTTNQDIYLRGTGNTKITGGSFSGLWFTGKYCTGNIETLLDYQTVANGQHPTMASNCFYGLFMDNSALTTPPELPATTLTYQCYREMFLNCISLTIPPELPATTLANYCYYSMFNGCASLTTPPQLSATILADYCYDTMFMGCSSLLYSPFLPSTELAPYCYRGMFRNCTSIKRLNVLPATTLTDHCYSEMFSGCSNLSAIASSSLPATTLASSCYYEMFKDCTSLGIFIALPATTLVAGCYYSMFNGCTSLRLSATSSNLYKKAYRIPQTGTGTDATNALTDMFTNIGGPFTGTPTINTTYYISYGPV